jgi:hypothetical protein
MLQEESVKAVTHAFNKVKQLSVGMMVIMLYVHCSKVNTCISLINFSFCFVFIFSSNTKRCFGTLDIE